LEFFQLPIGKADQSLVILPAEAYEVSARNTFIAGLLPRLSVLSTK
jgi:hypothetical protein